VGDSRCKSCGQLRCRSGTVDLQTARASASSGRRERIRSNRLCLGASMSSSPSLNADLLQMCTNFGLRVNPCGGSAYLLEIVLRYQLRGCLLLECSPSPYCRFSSFVASEDAYFVHAEAIITIPLWPANSSSLSAHELCLAASNPTASPLAGHASPESSSPAPPGTSAGTPRAMLPRAAWDLRRGAASSAATCRSGAPPGRRDLRRPAPLRTLAGTPLSTSSLSSSPGVARRWVGHAWAVGPLEGNGKDCERLPLGIDTEPDVSFDEQGYRAERMSSLLDHNFCLFLNFS
jgi:hypothetical protein